ncbi:pleiotropic drug resistance protein 2-like [Pyrus ussuriensis x Pyrus communis]|uniref:Pleiotropic drug resistance protein 2-like n=1 Tax=Pyrus ussuriensis x Pyrus communis TaxID=2448454 RepID=A0A5N5HZ52_9ROSA|nr:pleiotropic drug resistance protein 2-like [Pyrus ussuriensis x Pyrus communis]
MKATSLSGQKASLITDYVLKILGLDVCADTVVGDDMKRGISGGQRKRVTTALTFLDPIVDNKTLIDNDNSENKSKRRSNPEGTDMQVRNQAKKGMVLPFEPLSLAFNHMNYYVDMPPEMKSQGIEETRLQLLRDVSGAFRPGVLTALVGVSGAGKTTLMDVLAGRKTGGYIEGSITISGYPKNQATFARMFVDEVIDLVEDEVIDLVELNPLRDALVGLPGVNGLSTEQRKRLTISVELVANPSIIFMHEPTSGLDARAAAIVMRTEKPGTYQGTKHATTRLQGSLLPHPILPKLFNSVQSLLLKTTLVILEELAVQCH